MGAGNASRNAATQGRPLIHKNSRPRRKHGQGKRVAFDNEIRAYACPTALTQEDCCNLWYTSVEIESFRQARNTEAERLRTLAKESPSSRDESCVVWYRTLLLAYKHFRPAKSTYNVAAVLHWVGIYGFLSESGLGLERYVAMEVSYDVAKKRQAMWDQLSLWQVQPCDIQYRDEALRCLCESQSRPARLWAEYIAHAAALSSW
jgi:hypothetical protein